MSEPCGVLHLAISADIVGLLDLAVAESGSCCARVRRRGRLWIRYRSADVSREVRKERMLNELEEVAITATGPPGVGAI